MFQLKMHTISADINSIFTLIMKTNPLLTLLSVAAVTALAFNSYLLFASKGKEAVISQPVSSPVTAVTVDVDAVFKSHSGRLKLQEEIDAKAKVFTNEIEQFKNSSKKTAAELEVKRKALSEIVDEVERRKQQAELVEGIKGLRKFELEVAKKARAYQEQIAKDSAMAAASILDEIYQLIERKSKSLGYTQVINSKAVDKNGVPVVLYDHDVLDFTSLLIDEVNKSN